jgi:hypothetical protein
MSFTRNVEVRSGFLSHSSKQGKRTEVVAFFTLYGGPEPQPLSCVQRGQVYWNAFSYVSASCKQEGTKHSLRKSAEPTEKNRRLPYAADGFFGHVRT